MRNNIKKFFTTTNIKIASAKFCIAMAMVLSPALLRWIDQYLDDPPIFLLGLFFIGIPFLIQSFYQLGGAFRASPNKWVGVVLGCMLFGAIQASIGLFILVFGGMFFIVTLNFAIATKVVNTMSSYIKESFKWNPQVSMEKPAHVGELAQPISKKDEGKNRAQEVVIPAPDMSAMPENMTDYASYLENLNK